MIPHTKGDNAKPINMIADTNPLCLGKYSQHANIDGIKHSL